MTRTDAELLIASRDDPRAFRELYDRWADRLLAYFYRRTLDAEVAGDLLAETFAVAFERMGPGERDAVQLRVVEEMDYAEIASALGCTEAAARVRVHRGLARLNRLMEVVS